MLPVAKKSKGYLRARVPRTLSEIIGDDIFVVDGAKWVHQRKSGSNLFTKRTLRESMTATVRKHIVSLNEIIARTRNKRKPLYLLKLLNAFALQVFLEIGFGVEIDLLDPEQDYPFHVAFDGIMHAIMPRFFRPQLVCKIQQWLNVDAEANVTAYKKLIHATILDVLHKSIEAHQLGRSGGDFGNNKDLVSLFLDSTEDGQSRSDPTYLRDIVIAFLFAGQDTTSQSLFWFFENLKAAKGRD